MMNEKRFVNKGKDVFQYGEWWCSAGGEHCADVIAEALNIFSEENDQLRSEISMKDDLIQQLTIKLNKDYKRVEKDRDRLNDVVQHVWNVLLNIDRDKLCFEKRRFFDELCNELGFDLSRIRMIEIDIPIDSEDDK